MRLPDFFHVGPPKTGTTGLRATLLRVPDIALSSIPEPSFFAHDHEKRVTKGITSLEAYAGLFPVTPATRAVGDVSPVYLHSATAASAIRDAVPDARIVICLRHPVERAFSHYLMWAGHRKLSAEAFGDHLAAALDDPGSLPAARDARFARCSLYADAVLRFLDTFGPGRVLVLPYDRLVSDPAGWMRSLLDHVGLADVTAPAVVERQYQGRGIPGSWAAHRAVGWLRSEAGTWLPRPVRRFVGTVYRTANRKGPTALDPETVDRLYAHYRPDTRRLHGLTGIDFDDLWRNRASRDVGG